MRGAHTLVRPSTALVAAVLTVGLAAAAVQAVPEGPEPNGNPGQGGTPTRFACGSQGDGAIDRGGDEDWWTFTLIAPAQILATTGPGPSGFRIAGVPDTVLELYDAALNLVAQNDDFKVRATSQLHRGRYSLLQLDLPAGTWHLGVRAFGGAQSGSYTLDLQCTAPGRFVAEGAEPNDDPGSGGTPTPFATDRIGEGGIDVSGDRDWWTFTPGATTHVLAVTGPGGRLGLGVGDSTLTLRDSSGSQLAFDDDGGPGKYSQIAMTLAPGTYHLDVGGFRAQIGSYRLYLSTVPVPGAPVAEGAEPNDDPRGGGTPTPIACGQTGIGTISGSGGAPPQGDSDWWQFTLNRATHVTGVTLPAPASPVNDTVLILRGDDGRQLWFDDDGGTGVYSEIATYLTAGTYYFDVQGFGARDVGGYQLVLDCDGGVATFVASRSGCAGSNGTPTLLARDLEVPLGGTTLAVDFIQCPPGAPVFSIAGFSDTRTTSPRIPLPFDMTLIGAPGCLAEVDPEIITRLTADANGTAAWHVEVPTEPRLVGGVMFVQAFVVDPGANRLGITSSNKGVIVVGDRL